MASPFPANATLTFQVPVGEPGIDTLGNMTQATEPFVAQVYFREAKNRGSTSNVAEESERVSRLQLEGRLVEPDSLPANVSVKAAAVLRDLGGVATELDGDFFLEESLGSAFGTSAVLGAPIRGYFVRRVRWGEAL
ncbi:hypothetical protein ACQ4M4_12965 [Leptolyngbya sp. AN02str]|uniref:hypothetical protein n=1 Tax=Leptolyngbya sp. AN02str TaxID=3423363 RepID=UPI003D312E78